MSNDFNLWLHFWMSRLSHQMELRPLKRSGTPVYSFFGSRDPAQIEKAVEENNGNNIFFGILGREGHVGGKESIKEAHCLWVDIDFKDLPGGQAEADGLVATFDLRPSLQIFSGGGYHLYWFLKEPSTDLARVERVLKGLVPRLKSDPKVAQIACILRPPGTMNWKYDPPREVKVVSFSPESTYTLDDFAEWESKKEERKAPEVVEDTKEEQFDLEAYLKHYNVPVTKTKTFEDTTLYCLRKCFFEDNHSTNHGADNEAAIGRQEGGKLFYQCFHSSCRDKTWADVREKISGKKSLLSFVGRDIKPMIEKYVSKATGLFTIGALISWLDIKTFKEREIAMTVIEELETNRIITRTGNKHGTYRPIDRDPRIMKLGGEKGEPSKILLPLDLHKIVNLYPKNVIIVAGEKDSGKTSFSMNSAYLNRDIIPVRYINSEMGTEELESRLKLFPDKHLSEWKKITWIEQSSKFEDAINPDGLNIIDFLEIGKDAFEAVEDIKRVFDRLKKGLLLIVMQKRSYKDFAVGGEGTLEKARLAINLEKRKGLGNVCKITVAKNWTGLIQHPKGCECQYKIWSGGKMEITPRGWYKPEEEPIVAGRKPLRIVGKKNPLEGISSCDPDFPGEKINHDGGMQDEDI